MRLRDAVAFLYLLLISCAYLPEWNEPLLWDGRGFSELPGPEDIPDAGALMILDEGKIEVIGSSEIPLTQFERHQVVKILSVQGLKYANITIPYTPSTEVEGIQARTISPQGEIYTLDPEKIYDVTLYPGFIFYSDQRAKIFTMPAVERGAIVEYRYRVKIANRSLSPSWRFQHDIPTLTSRFSVVAPSEWEVRHKVYDMELKPKVVKAPSGFKSSFTWEAQDIPALISEFGMPSVNDVGVRLEVVPVGIESWDDVGMWYSSLAEPRTKAGARIKKLATELTGTARNDSDKVRAIYEWVRDNVRYIAVAIGIGGFQPHPAEDVLANRYGDCKDMTTLLCALAREAGVEANHVLVSTWQNGKPDTSLPSPYLFNHAMAYCPTVGEKGMWMDATEKGCPFTDLPWYDQDVEVLVIDKSGKTEILTTPHEHSGYNRTIIDWSADLEPSGGARVRGRTQFWGAVAAEIREELGSLSRSLWRQWLEIYLAKRCSGAKLDSFTVQGLAPVEDPLELTYFFQSATFAVPRQDELVLRPCQILAFDLPDYFRAGERLHPVRFKFGMLEELYLSVYMPEQWRMVTADHEDTLSSAHGSASWYYTTTRNRIIRAHQHILINGEQISPDRYLDFQRFLDDIRVREFREIVVRHN